MTLTPDLLLHGYSIGIFPMAEARDDPDIFWVDPRRRGVIPLEGFRMSRSLARAIRSERMSVSVNRDFAGVVDGCAERDETWINGEIRDLYVALHRLGHAHSIELWDGDDLAGGVYGVALGTAFSGKACSRAGATRRRSRLRIWWTGCGGRGSRCSTRSF